MTTINRIQPYRNKKSAKRNRSYVGITGFGAGAGMVLTMASGYTKNKSFKMQHKNIALLTASLTAAHILLTKLAHTRKKN